ncbi:hypothetical protein [Xenorhabdus innexi]|uniref:Uncharacterized protein n=1 Tax=Xenorhabdus innexi TaxID=290109 RepID=A0A1N6MWT0_9GAMM|nr:hypothetical protein [Xenorhabdus innexi]PHM35928.1 hypothetical protein Xinn_01998 [Xenorhabdus innexi]SIP73227.1 hypothetical protein XIS1_1790033 [Xenorhabdus innexi]
MAEKVTRRTRRQTAGNASTALAYETPQTRQQKATEELEVASSVNSHNTLVESKAPRKRVHFQRGGTALQPRHNPNQLLQVRGYDENVTALRERMKPPVSPGATPLAIIDAYGHIMPFDAESPIDRVVLASVPDISYIYTHDDLQEALRINQEKIRQRRFHETVQGARLFVEPIMPTHGFRNGNEVVSAFYDETRMGNDAVVIQDLNDMSKDVF